MNFSPLLLNNRVKIQVQIVMPNYISLECLWSVLKCFQLSPNTPQGGWKNGRITGIMSLNYLGFPPPFIL